MRGYANSQLLITPRELAAAIDGDPATRPLVLDMRAPEAYAAGHVPGALHLDLWGLSLTDTDPAPLNAFSWMIEHVLAIHGVSASTPVVVYDENTGIRAARAFWFFEYFGHSSVRVLDGGWGAWSREQLPVATWRDVKAALSQPNVVVLDTRSDGEYCGTTVRAKRGGAIPGAVHIEWTRNLTPEGEYKSAADLQKMYEDAGVTKDREVITYCQGGYRAAHSYLALRLLGYPHVRNYLGSWKEWGDREELPIETNNRP
jgi:thiosulfate/3-mercaptopyruvate sulfurtransferase